MSGFRVLVVGLLVLSCSAPPVPPATAPSAAPAASSGPARECVAASAGNQPPALALTEHQRGLALVREAELEQPAASKELFAAAQEPLEKCIELAPGFANCHFLLGEVALWLDDEALAAERYVRAIELDATQVYYYARLAELYFAYRHDLAAAAVLDEALRFVPAEGGGPDQHFTVLLALARLTQESDRGRALGYLARAEPLAETGPAVFAYELGLAYVNLGLTSDDELKQKVAALMKRFHDRTCHNAPPQADVERCSTASGWVTRFAHE